METVLALSVLEFSLPFYEALDKKGNEFISPYNVSAALMLLLLGSDGETKSELETALKVRGLSTNEIHAGYNLLHKTLTSRGGNWTQVSIANRIFSKEGIAVKQTFSDDVLKYYGSEVELLDFVMKTEDSRKRINSWIEKQTNDKIIDMIPKGELDECTRMVLTNAIYFKGEWEFKFDKQFTSKTPFYIYENYSVQVDMMSAKIEVMSGESTELDCKCLQLPYKGNMLSMVILLPNKRTGLNLLESKLTAMTLQNAISHTYEQETIISIPKFRIEASYEMTNILTQLGITQIFTTSANFSGIYEVNDMFVRKVFHKAFVEVDEGSTEAAVATVIVTVPISLTLSSSFEFIADHPFLFLIRDNTTGTILFIDRYATPPCPT